MCDAMLHIDGDVVRCGNDEPHEGWHIFGGVEWVEVQLDGVVVAYCNPDIQRILAAPGWAVEEVGGKLVFGPSVGNN